MSNGYIDKAEVEAILSGGQPAVNKFVVETVIALKHGQEQQHDLIEDFGNAGKDRERRLAKLETWQVDTSSTCVERVKKLIHEEHDVRHEKHMAEMHPIPRRKDDPEDADYSGDRRVWLMWNIGSRITNILFATLGAAIVVLINYLATGKP